MQQCYATHCLQIFLYKVEVLSSLRVTSWQFGVSENKADLLLRNTTVEEHKKWRGWSKVQTYLLSKSGISHLRSSILSHLIYSAFCNYGLIWNTGVLLVSHLATRLEVEHYHIPCNSLLPHFIPDPFGDWQNPWICCIIQKRIFFSYDDLTWTTNSLNYFLSCSKTASFIWDF